MKWEKTSGNIEIRKNKNLILLLNVNTNNYESKCSYTHERRKVFQECKEWSQVEL
jgi:hypothetical protein